MRRRAPTRTRTGWRLLLAGWGCAALLCAAPAVGWAETDEAQQPFTYDPAGHRDPFVALVRDGRIVGNVAQRSLVSLDRPVLYGILWDPGGRSIALINDLEARVGDTVAGYRVQEIRRDAVVLVNGGEPLELSISFDEPGGLFPEDRMGGENKWP